MFNFGKNSLNYFTTNVTSCYFRNSFKQLLKNKGTASLNSHLSFCDSKDKKDKTEGTNNNEGGIKISSDNKETKNQEKTTTETQLKNIENDDQIKVTDDDKPITSYQDPNLQKTGIFRRFALSLDRAGGKIAKYLEENLEVVREETNILVIGGGLVGSSIAFHLKEDNEDVHVTVVEQDTTFTNASSLLSVGGIRHQFSIPENIFMAQYGMDFLKQANKKLFVELDEPPFVQMNYGGYLTLATKQGLDILKENYETQKNCECYVDMLSKRQLEVKFPWLRLDDIEAGIYGVESEGWFDPWSLMSALMKKCKCLGTKYVHGEVIKAEVIDINNFMFQIETPPIEDPLAYRRCRNVIIKQSNGKILDLQPDLVVIAAGCWSGQVGRLFGIGEYDEGPLSFPIPVEPRKRYVYNVHSPGGPRLNCPMVIDPSGAYFRRDGLGDMYLCGRAPPEEALEPDSSNLDVDSDYFKEHVWPQIAHRCPSFEGLKIKSSWAGYYDYNTFDQNAIIGKHPLFHNVYMATGFSGHGIQMAAGAGKVISDLVYRDAYDTIDLTRFEFSRILHDRPILEKCCY